MLDLSHRKEGIRRIQIGLSGLAGVVLLIGLANIVVNNVRRDDATAGASADNADNGSPSGTDDKPTEPLAELGVTPSHDSSSDPVVEDLQPDPNLRERLDQPSPNPPQSTPSSTSSAPNQK